MALSDGKESILAEYRRRARPVIVDGLMWLTVIAFLLLVFSALKLLEARGYGKGRIELLENIHFIGSTGMLLLMMYDMFMKTLSIIGSPER